MRFGFVVHPLSPLQKRLLGVRTADLQLARTGQTSRPPARLISKLKLRDPSGRLVRGVLASVPQLPGELLSEQEDGVKAVIEAVELCRSRGAEVVGLGAVAAMIGGQGKAVARAASVPVSTGNAFTAFAALQTIAQIRRLDRQRAPIGLVGPPGPVANAILSELASQGERVEIVSPQPPRPLTRLVEKLNRTGHGELSFVDGAASVLGPGRVLVAASSTGGRLPLSSIPAGSIIIDVAAPQDVLHDVPRRDDVLLLDGEYVRMPRQLTGDMWRRVYGWVTGQRRSIFACFAEPMLLALAQRTELCSVGRKVDPATMRALGHVALQHGFCVDRLHEYGRPAPAARIKRFFGDG